ncbi:hypothetical protein [Micromonospora siamensis]|uniref:Uncharacterized protein n=1 Tax=Micromonospora siamensis TaxID=299152 RepID=A0A1C5JSG0_9ACTN|nr:hypothetical protein [Micromonospora siamensis]SCG73433.1 hypothetical protein GA0074704_4910 [Micromonospora siamensis]
MAADPIWEFDRRVAEVRADDGATGYLYVELDDSPRGDGLREVSVDMTLVPANGGPRRAGDYWWFSDRADPDPGDAREELRTGLVDWYGRTLRVQRWLSGPESDLIVGWFPGRLRPPSYGVGGDR